MLLGFSEAPANPAGAAAAAPRVAGAPLEPPTGPPALYPLLVGRFWFSPRADCVYASVSYMAILLLKAGTWQ